MQESSQFTTIDEAVALAATSLQNVSRSDRRLFRALAWRAIEEIGPSELFVKKRRLTEIDNFSVRKPDDWLATRFIALYDGEDQLQHIYSDSKKIHKNDSAREGVIYINEDAYFIYMDSSATNVDCVVIEYYSLPISEDGEPLVPRHYLTAIENYILYKYWLKTSQNLGMIGMLKNEWKITRANARAKGKMPNMEKGSQIIRQWMTMIPKMSQKYLN